MDTAFPSVSWEEALRGFLIHYQATRAAKTVRFYKTQLTGLIRWAEEHSIALESFGKRHLDEYLVYRQESGTSKTTLHHDALSAKVFMKWCQRYDVISRSLLADYQVRNAPKPHKYMPTQE